MIRKGRDAREEKFEPKNYHNPMKHRDEIFSWVLAILILFSMIGVSWVTYKITKRKFKKESSNNFENQKTDTVYIPEIFTIPEPFEIIMNPSKVEIYRKDTTSKYNEFSLREKDLVLFTPNRLDSLIIDLNYLKNLPMNPKLLSLDLNQNQLSLGLLDINGITSRISYPLNLQNYSYRWNGNFLTSKKQPNFKFYPTLGYQYRILNNFHDIDLKLNFKTRGFNYELGLNGFYYPKFKSDPGWDITIGLTYDF